ncbi:MAG: hypothetical protein D3914_14765 [Candidatus Electrothrix sp. LOE2]|nr:hypothetical protein [Candidatus Electrothrix sp. LOE2]
MALLCSLIIARKNRFAAFRGTPEIDLFVIPLKYSDHLIVSFLRNTAYSPQIDYSSRISYYSPLKTGSAFLDDLLDDLLDKYVTNSS